MGTHGNIGCALSLIAAVVFASSASAQEPVRARLSVQADARCATAEQVIAQVQKRSQRIVLVADGSGSLGSPTTETVPRVIVSIGVSSEGDRVAELIVEQPDGQRSVRELRAKGCAAAVDALSLLVAMTLDPSAQESSAPSDGPAANGASAAGTGIGQTPEEAPASDAATVAEPTGAPAAQPAEAAAAEVSATREPSDESSSEADVDDGGEETGFALAFDHVAFGLGAQLAVGPAPSVLPGIGFHARLVWRSAEPLSHALALGLFRAWRFGLAERGGDADFELQVARLELCPIGLRAGPLAAYACAALHAGRLLAEGSGSYAPQSHAEPWVTGGGGLLFSLRLVSLVELHAGFSVERPLHRYQFAFRPEVFHQVPGAAFGAYLGAGLRFP